MTTLPTRQATATVYRIEAGLFDATQLGQPPRSQLIHGYGTISARVDLDGSDYTWRVVNPNVYRIGDRVEVTVPA
jgi:hypothetical protein